jgi:hypothetical protein
MYNDSNPYQSPQATVTQISSNARSLTRSGFKSGTVVGIVALVAIWCLVVLHWIDASFWGIGIEGMSVTSLIRFMLILRILGLLAFMVAAIAFIRWLYRVHGNLWSLGNRYVTWSTSWASWGWIVPIGNLFIPWQVAEEAWYGSDPNLIGDGTNMPRKCNPWLVRCWWLSYLFMNAAALILPNIHGESVRMLKVMFGLPLESMAALLATWMIVKMNENQRRRLVLVEEKRAAEKAREAAAPHEGFPLGNPADFVGPTSAPNPMNMPWLDP